MTARYSRDTLVVDEDYRPRARSEVRIRERERSRDRDPLARYFQDDRRATNDALVVHRQVRSPSVVRVRDRASSVSPPTRELERIEIRDHHHASPRQRSPSPDRHIRISHSRAPSPSPSPPPKPAREVVERDVITHYKAVDHGVVYARPPERRSDVEVDVITSRNSTKVDIDDRRARERARLNRRLSPAPPRHGEAASSDVVVRTDRAGHHLEVDIDDRHGRSHSHHRSRSMVTPRSSRHVDLVYEDDYDYADDDDYIEARIDERGRLGEAYRGVTRDWTLVDVPPGTERVRMDGVGGGTAEVTWQRYNGVRRTRILPERDSRDSREGDVYITVPDHHHHDRRRESDRTLDVEIDIDHHDSRRSPRDDTWTEMTKDLVNREAIERYQYPYTETQYFFYIAEYLHQDQIEDLISLTDRIRRDRRRKKKSHPREEIDIDVRERHRSRSRPRRYRDGDRVYEEVIVDSHPRAYRY